MGESTRRAAPLCDGAWNALSSPEQDIIDLTKPLPGESSRDPGDSQVSILEVAGTAAAVDEVREMEGRWQKTLLGREVGLNRNLAKA